MEQAGTDVASPAEKLDAYTNPRYRYYVLGMLTLVYAFNFIDRQLLVILQESIKEEMLLSDSQLGLLTGFAFALFYVVCGIPIAVWADRWIRRDIIAISLATWSLMTAATGYAQNFSQLLLARIGVGVGEAGGSPPAHAMISDMFSERKRATALSIYSIGVNIGILFGFLLGGWLNEFYGWRTAFVVVGLPGVALAVVLKLTVAEPRRGMAEQMVAAQESPSLLVTLKLLWSRPTFRHMSLAAALHALVGYGMINWIPSMFLRLHDIGTGELGTWLALSAGVGGAVGTFLGGYVTDALGVRDKRWYQWIPAITTLLVVPLMLIVYLHGNTQVALAAYILPMILYHMYLAPTLAVTHSLVSLRMRAVSSAVLFFMLNLIGLGIGPWLIGFISDQLAPALGAESIRYALLWVGSVVSIWSAWHYFLAAKYTRDDLARG